MPTKTSNRLPESVQQIADVIGREAALRLVAALPPCGARPWRRFLYVPRVAADDHLLVQVLGRATAQKLVQHFRDCILEPSACLHLSRLAMHEAMRADFEAGMSRAQLALHYGVHYNTVRRVVTTPPEAQIPANDNHLGHRRKP